MGEPTDSTELQGQVVGALAWGGQPSDHGTLQLLSDTDSEAIPIKFVERLGLRCVCHSPQPLTVGERVRQNIDVKRRWDNMQQHTGQHLLSAVMNSYDGLNTLGWGMGSEGDMNYVDLARKPSEAEMEAIQARCNTMISENLSIAVDTPSDAKQDRLPGDYDKSKGVIRVISIGGIDRNTCCGTHLRQTSHISLILLGSTQTVHGKNCRLSFTAGRRAIDLSASSVGAMRSMARLWSCGQGAEEVAAAASRTNDALADLKKREKKLLAEIATYEVDRIKSEVQKKKAVWVYRADTGLEFFTGIIAQVKESVKGQGAVLLMASGEEKKSGSIVIYGEPGHVQVLTGKVQEAIEGVKGGGKGEKWQGKVTEWKKGQLEGLREVARSYAGSTDMLS
ncbi:unnamed protein product [Clonostachys rosea]|uniref:Threonyl/alanyl tRNA synthetase SAD domain-containing protein n=1 Tax=Bionectria ochroleuca TaxID=29856 RepID=A0ABY6UK23_BIOOC|nr:unnamed protein product [Clonostachys rosea]